VKTGQKAVGEPVSGPPAPRSTGTGFLPRSHRLTHPVSPYDRIAVQPDDPAGWHVRERMDDGYPLMGSSPAERADARARQVQVRQQAMRDHAFEGEGPYCRAWIGPSYAGNAETGLVTMRVGCGYPRDTHPDQGRGD
jgi:hypothetical protein